MTTKDATLTGNVIITSSAGIVLRTESLKWKDKEKILISKDKIVVEKGGSKIEGMGFRASFILNDIEIFEVTGSIKPHELSEDR